MKKIFIATFEQIWHIHFVFPSLKYKDVNASSVNEL